MLLSDERRKVMENLVLEGKTSADIKDICSVLHVDVEEDVQMKWKNTLERPSKIAKVPHDPKLINRFCVGADPEYIFESESTGEYIYASALDLDTLSAFGCDMSGRQAELRMYPSRFVLEGMASLVDALRWSYAMKKKIRACAWKALPYYQNGVARDGCGGHIHFGRKRPNRKKELRHLDGVGRVLLDAGVLSLEQHQMRRDNTNYGKWGDYRPQSYGYEWRTLPTWMGNPAAAYMTLVASKLALLLPEPLKSKNSVAQLTNLIFSYKHRDDDAAILTRMIARIGLPKAYLGDFKANWGVGAKDTYEHKDYYIPPIIPPCKETIRELFEFFVNGTPLPIRAPNVTWPLFKLPENFSKVEVVPKYGGLPEIAMGLLSYNTDVIISTPCERDTMKIISSFPLNLNNIQKAARDINPAWDVDVYGSIIPGERDNSAIQIYPPTNIADHFVPNLKMVDQIRQLLLESGEFPICTIKDYDKAVFKKSYAAIDNKPRKMLGRMRLQQRGGGE